MQSFSIPVCYFPGTALFVDDSRDFLLNFVLQLDESLAYRIYDSPFDAMEHIENTQGERQLISQRCLWEYKEYKQSGQGNPALLALHADLYNPQRFADVSVVVVDYAMPGMDGLEFCRRINNSHIRKILLTGKADEKLAIEAFNEGLIHRYIHKSDPHAAELITRSIYELQWQYFQDMSQTIERSLSLDTPACYKDKAFVSFFRRFCQDKGIVEFYQADKSGSLILLDDDARVSFLVVKNALEQRLFHSMGQAHGADEATLAQLADGEKIPCFWQADDTPLTWKNIASRLVPAFPVPESDDYVYAHVSEPALFEINQERVLSYHDYLQKIDVEELIG
ncbi:response regulator [Legionella sp. CNM-4043-24]|uniref:response regulator n=1 Tax=Legionella sp. CNM-4043-24 TaxID=3421646 RepID=UPI00403A9CAD